MGIIVIIMTADISYRSYSRSNIPDRRNLSSKAKVTEWGSGCVPGWSTCEPYTGCYPSALGWGRARWGLPRFVCRRDDRLLRENEKCKFNIECEWKYVCANNVMGLGHAITGQTGSCQVE